jgi:hypothetical protein
VGSRVKAASGGVIIRRLITLRGSTASPLVAGAMIQSGLPLHLAVIATQTITSCSPGKLVRNALLSTHWCACTTILASNAFLPLTGSMFMSAFASCACTGDGAGGWDDVSNDVIDTRTTGLGTAGSGTETTWMAKGAYPLCQTAEPTAADGMGGGLPSWEMETETMWSPPGGRTPPAYYIALGKIIPQTSAQTVCTQACVRCNPSAELCRKFADCLFFEQQHNSPARVYCLVLVFIQAVLWALGLRA